MVPLPAVQVNVACRASAVAPGVADSLAAFAGVYCSHMLPDIAGKPADAGFELAISVAASGARPCLPLLSQLTHTARWLAARRTRACMHACMLLGLGTMQRRRVSL
jgi:hypothetical protein